MENLTPEGTLGGSLPVPASIGLNVQSNELQLATVNEILENIRTNEDLEDLICAIRAELNQEEKRELKKKSLPYFNLGIYKDNKRQSSYLKSIEHLLYDLDHLGSELQRVKEMLKADKRVFSVFTSPGGDGLKVIFRLAKAVTDPAEYSKLYRHYADEFKEKYGIEPDNTPDAARACFFSFDPDIYVNPDALPLSTSVLPKGSDSLKAINFRQMKMDEIDGAIEFIRNMKITYQEWISCGFALVSEFGRDGKEYFIHLSDNPNFPDFTVEKASAKYDELLLNSQNQVNIESLFHIAQKYGFIFSEDYNKYISYLPLEDKKPFSFADELRNRFKFDDERDPNILLGFQLKKFRELAQHIDGIQPGFYLLGAESNVGKTAVLTNICLDAIDTNPDISVIYFSLDDSRIYTVYRLLSILTGYNINDVRKKQNDSVKKAHLDEKREEIIKLIESGRLVIKDVAEVQHVKDLEKEIKAITDKSKLMVFIDGLYNLEVAEKAMGIREENIERARIIKQLVDTYRIPIFTTGELRKKAKEEGKDKAPTLNDLMETGKFAYNANVVWLLYGKQEDLKTPEPMLTLEYVKNKLSDYKSEQVLVFKRSTGTITEISLSDASSGFGLERPKTPLFEDNGGLI